MRSVHRPTGSFQALTEMSDGADPVIWLGGDLDMATVPRAWELIAQAVAAGSSRIVIDLRDVTFLDSSGLDLFVRTAGVLEGDAAGGIVLRSPSAATCRLLDLAGLADRFEVR